MAKNDDNEDDAECATYLIVIPTSTRGTTFQNSKRVLIQYSQTKVTIDTKNGFNKNIKRTNRNDNLIESCTSNASLTVWKRL